MYKVGGDGQQMMFNILKAYSVYDTEIGYCQGLSFCLGPLLMAALSEIEAFAVLVRLLESENDTSRTGSGGPAATVVNYGLKNLFTPSMSGLHILLYQVSLQAPL